METRLIDGTAQAVAWDLRSGVRRVLTDRSHGVQLSEIEPDGGHIWWFDGDGDGADDGQWCRTPFGGGDSRPAMTGVPVGKPRGVGFDRDGALAAVCVGVAHWTRCFVGPPGGSGREIYAATGHCFLVDVSPDGTTLALAGAPDGSAAVVLCDVRTGETTTLVGSRERRLWPLEFDPEGKVELLLMVERDADFTVATWSPGEPIRRRDHLAFPSTASAGWYPGGRRVLIQHEAAGRSRLLIADLDSSVHSADVRELPVPSGTVHDLSCAPDGSIHCLWSSAGSAAVPLVIDSDGNVEQAPHKRIQPAESRQRSRQFALRDLWTETDYGAIHSFLTPPVTGEPPWPTVFLVHGGPATHDRDGADPRVEALCDAGYAVVRTNYRGSTGYGPAWQHGFGQRVGLAQIEDLAAVRAHLIDEKLAAEDRIALFGYSWGGYLALLAVGAQPQLWSAAVAVHPIGDYVRCFDETTPVLRDVDIALFGGTPEQFPDRYAAASPITYVPQVRVPLLLIGAIGDERCPVGQLESYISALCEHGTPHRAVWRSGGHGGAHLDEQSRIMALALGFLGAPASGATVEIPRGGAA